MKTKLDYLLSIVIFCTLVAFCCALLSYYVWWATAAAFQEPKPEIVIVPVEGDVYIPDDNLPDDCATFYSQLPADETITTACFYNVNAKSLIGSPDMLVALSQEAKTHLMISGINDANQPTWTLLFKTPPSESFDIQRYEQTAPYSSIKTEAAQLRLIGLSPFIDCHGGDVVIHEIGYDTDGRITKLALDFEQKCPASDVTHIRGHIRYQAATPIVR